MPMVILAIAGAAAAGYFLKSTGEGVDKASNGAVKLAAAGVVGYVVLKKSKVI